MTTKTLPVSADILEQLVREFPTPLHIYDEQAIVSNARRLLRAFDWCPGFHEYFAVKALPNPTIMRLLRDEGFGMDCSSLAELKLCERIGVRGEDIMFTSNDTPAADFAVARKMGAIINLDDITHLDTLSGVAPLPELLALRYNPGALRGGNCIIGKPEEAKYGLTRAQLFEAYGRARDGGVTRFGLHTMIASNELDLGYLTETARMLFVIADELTQELGITLDFINIGGGIGIPYHPDETAVDIEALSRGIEAAYRQHFGPAGPKLYMESGRMITGPYGYLVTRVIHEKHTYRDYLGCDASMADLMRPGMYGAYHHLSVVGREDAPHEHIYDVTGSLCENNDKFATRRSLPNTQVGDLIVIHDTGAHGHAMGFNYNGKTRSAEVLLRPNGAAQLIRRAETLDDLFATLEFTAKTVQVRETSEAEATKHGQ